jgi:hypothetical protein
MDCLCAFLPDSIWERLSKETNSALMSKLSMNLLSSKGNHYKPLSTAEFKRLFFTRLDLILRNRPGLKEGFDVRTLK